ncbi:MAG: chitobiase/beta-hexosaminidase C-terminal domain-containing protein [Deltaproteobacteria bacterium]|nr:chitobiase/beta-hexosaminidase C-terminal domain-containing protein [Deltaproteobacteria bacterium]
MDIQIPQLENRQIIEQYGVTWTFDKPMPVGKFINGDWYVVGQATIIDIDPPPLFGQQVVDAGWTLIECPRGPGGKREGEGYLSKCHINEVIDWPNQWARNGSMINPCCRTAAYDSRLGFVGDYYHPENFKKPIITLNPGDSLVSTKSRPLEPEYNMEEKNYSYYVRPIDTAPILTCVATPQPPDAFRPSYAPPPANDPTKSHVYLARNLKRELLSSLPLPDNAPDIEEWIRKFQQPWLDHIPFGKEAPYDHMPSYGQWFVWAVSKAALMLHLNYPQLQKERLLINYIQVGIDLWGLVNSGARTEWQAIGGCHSGRKWPIIFAGMMLEDKDMQTLAGAIFSEDQHYYFAPTWSGENVAFQSHITQLESRTDTRYPSTWTRDGHDANSYEYKLCCTNPYMSGQALAARMMKAEPLWNHASFFAYADRWRMADLQSIKDTIVKYTGNLFATWITTKTTINELYKFSDPFEKYMWETYRYKLPGGNHPIPIDTAYVGISPVPDVYASDSLEITIVCSEPTATIRYTLDDSIPDENSNFYTVPFKTTAKIITARAFDSNGNKSAVAQAIYDGYSVPDFPDDANTGPAVDHPNQNNIPDNEQSESESNNKKKSFMSAQSGCQAAASGYLFSLIVVLAILIRQLFK